MFFNFNKTIIFYLFIYFLKNKKGKLFYIKKNFLKSFKKKIIIVFYKIKLKKTQKIKYIYILFFLYVSFLFLIKKQKNIKTYSLKQHFLIKFFNIKKITNFYKSTNSTFFLFYNILVFNTFLDQILFKSFNYYLLFYLSFFFKLYKVSFFLKNNTLNISFFNSLNLLKNFLSSVFIYRYYPNTSKHTLFLTLNQKLNKNYIKNLNLFYIYQAFYLKVSFLEKIKNKKLIKKKIYLSYLKNLSTKTEKSKMFLLRNKTIF
jgi:hypothetical protein